MIRMQGNRPEDTNFITEPKKIVPVTTVIKGMNNHFARTILPYYISILQILK